MEVILDMYKVDVAPCSCGATPCVSMVADPDVGEMYRIECPRCGEHTAKKFSPEKAAKVWNNERKKAEARNRK